MFNTFAKKIIKLSILVMFAFLLVAMIDSKIMRRTMDFTVQNAYESISTNEVFPPLDTMEMDEKSIEITVDGNVHISSDANNIHTKLFNPKYKFEFIGEIKFGDYDINFDVSNPLVSTEIIFDSKWATYASRMAMTTTTIHDKLYFLGATVIHDNQYNVERICLDIYDTSKVLIGQFVFNIE